MFTITDSQGKTKQVKIEKFPALDGWEIQQRFVEFAASRDKDFRRDYTLEVLRYATVLQDNGGEIPLHTDALIDNHLQSWQNVQGVFEAVLNANGIDPNTHAMKTAFWAESGQELAIAFIAEASKLIGPAATMLGRQMDIDKE